MSEERRRKKPIEITLIDILLSGSGSPLIEIQESSGLIIIQSGQRSHSPCVTYDLGTAHYNFNATKYIPEGILDSVRDEIGVGVQTGETEDVGEIRKVFSDMRKRETEWNGSEEDVFVLPIPTRQSIDLLFRAFAGRSGQIAMPLPNWHFWNLDGFANQEYDFAYFEASTEQELVDNFRKIAPKKKIKALVLVDPVNPLLYRISEAAAREIDTIALKYGVEIIIDDVMRGNQPLGQRESLSRWFTMPYVVEGLSKRFGDKPCGYLSYILVPEGNRKVKQSVPRVSPPPFGLARTVENIFIYGEQPALKELERRNDVLDSELGQACPEMRIRRPSPSHMISVLELPRAIHAGELTVFLYDQHPHVLTGSFENYDPEQRVRTSHRHLLRVST